jgi:hypothetical protein
VTLEPGLDLHEWETRWQELQDVAAESPADAVPELVRLIEQMLVERGYDLASPVAAGGEEPEVVSSYQAARELVTAYEAGDASAGDLAGALENLNEVHHHLIGERRTP